MRIIARTATLLALMLLTFGSAASAQISFGITIGAPPAPRVMRVQPRRPGADYVWVDGYWYAVGRKYTWHEGSWIRPPYAGASWVGPHHDGTQFFQGYWTGDQGRLEYNQKLKHQKSRDDQRNDRR